MKYTKLGNSDLQVSRICMGCMGFGDAKNGQHSWTLDEEHSREIIKRGLELGVNFYDTAIGYQSGTSEQYVGRALKDFAKRDEVVVATKFLPRTEEEIAQGITGQQHIERMINTSLSNLGMDYVDLYIYHMWDYQTPLYDIMDGLNRIVKAGKARYIGISNCFAWQLAKANALAEKEGFTKFVSIQGHYNLIFREEEREMAKLCEEENIAMTPYSALAGGRLSKHPGETSKRLEILNKSNDGFYIAGEDLKLRGPGDLFGIRQSGLLEFKLGDIYQDADILKAASETAADILALDEDLTLEQNEELRRKLTDYMKEDLQNLGL